MVADLMLDTAEGREGGGKVSSTSHPPDTRLPPYPPNSTQHTKPTMFGVNHVCDLLTSLVVAI